ncbi:MAG TPA: glycosyltransferase [candidate division Zixibacteria bacterium]|nr:glycosyltransferase [candidate division Zixibacteria bacterium]
MSAMRRYCIIGPTHPFRGGISHYMTLLAQHLAVDRDLLFISFTRQYPGWLFPGNSDRDPSHEPLTFDAEYLLDPINPLSWRRTLKRVSNFQADVVVIPWWVPYWAPAWSILGRRIQKLPDSPVLLFICHNVFPHERGRLDRVAAKAALSPGDGYIVHAASDAQKLYDLFPDARVKVTPHPSYAGLVNVERSPLPVQLPSDRPLLLFCGFVRPYKGLDILLNALPMVLERKQVHLLIAGEFWQRSDVYQGQIRELNLSDNVTVIDQYIPNEMLATCLDRAAVVVLPYRSATQSGIVQIAFGLNTPVITTDVGGLSESVDDGITGLVVPPEDSESLAQAIIRFFEHNLGPEMVENIKADSDRFGWQPLIDKLEDLASPRTRE